MIARAEKALDKPGADLRRPEQCAERHGGGKVAPFACRKISRCTTTIEPIAAAIDSTSARRMKITLLVRERRDARWHRHYIVDGMRHKPAVSLGITAICSGSDTNRCSPA